MLTDEMKEVALLVAGEMPCCCNHVYVSEGVCWSQSELLEFAERVLAALPKPEPVGTFYQCSDGIYHQCTEYYVHAEKLYTAPPPQDTAAIEQRVAEACANVCLDRAKIEKSKAVSSRYSGAIAMAQMYDQNSEQAELLSKEIVEQWREFL